LPVCVQAERRQHSTQGSNTKLIGCGLE
jgi:hypothetical protein